MKLVTFEQGGRTRIGALVDNDQVVDFGAAAPSLPQTMRGFLGAGATAHTVAQQIIAHAPASSLLRLADVKLRAPVPDPGKIICIGLNYRDHAAETNQPVPDYPTVFSKYGNAVNDPGGAILIPKVTNQVDYEAELGVVIGRRARHVSEADALSYVGGYLPFHDVSARDYQRRTTQWTIGKTFDTFAPMGPALTTADEIPDPHTLDIQLSIGGEVLQKSNTRELIFGVQHLIAYLTAVMTLEPGDVIATGTPSGVGAARNPKRWLLPGEMVRIEIAKLGVLENPVAAEG
jgi:2-keto-4-pentenoate hydratase/2-oxohepta-3-ene-1,7-dioic acid hydratase in catechol pathway